MSQPCCGAAQAGVERHQCGARPTGENQNQVLRLRGSLDAGGHHGHGHYPNREGFPGRKADSRHRVLRRADAAREGEFPHHRHPDVARAELRQGVRLREEGGGAREPRSRGARRQGRRRDRRRVRPADRGRDARSVRDRLHPGRRRNVDEHERERGHREPRAGKARAQEGRVPVRQSERPRELRAVDERRLPDGVPPCARAAALELHRRAAPAAGCLLREGQGVRPGAEDGPHPPAGCGADVARPGIPRLGHDDGRGSAADQRGAPVPVRDQPGRDGDRHDGDGCAGLPGARDQVPLRAHRIQVHPRGRPDRGDLRHRRLRASVGRAEADVGQAHQDLQRHPAAGVGSALRA